MSVTTLDQVVAGFQPTRFFSKAVTPTLVAGRPASLWGLGGIPGAGSFDNTLNGVTLSSSSAQVAGQLPHVDPGSGLAYVAQLMATASQAGILLVLDRLWHNGNISATSTSPQSITSPTWPARDDNASTNGTGVLLALEVSAATGAGTPTITISYTNQAGTSGRTATNIIATNASSAAGALYFIGLQAGDTGVRSVQSITLSQTWTSGTINLVAYRVLGAVGIATGGIPAKEDAVTLGMPTVPNGAVPWLAFVPSATTATNVIGTYVETQG